MPYKKKSNSICPEKEYRKGVIENNPNPENISGEEIIGKLRYENVAKTCKIIILILSEIGLFVNLKNFE